MTRTDFRTRFAPIFGSMRPPQAQSEPAKLLHRRDFRVDTQVRQAQKPYTLLSCQRIGGNYPRNLLHNQEKHMSTEYENTLYISAPTAEQLDLFIEPINMPRLDFAGSITREFHNMPDGSKSVEMFFVTRKGPPADAYQMLWTRKQMFAGVELRASFTSENEAWQVVYRWDFEKMAPVVAADGLSPGFIELESGQSLNDMIRRALEEIYSKFSDDFGKNSAPCKWMRKAMEKYPLDADPEIPF
jgi:hypothetical protein